MMLQSRPLQELQLPFVMDLERPRKTRLELEFAGQTALQVYDGADGWKLRPYLNRRVVEPFTEEELKVSSAQADLDGPLVDYGATGTRIELIGMDKVEGHDAYKVKMTTTSGQALYVWIDAQTFLEAKIDGQPRRMDGTDHPNGSLLPRLPTGRRTPDPVCSRDEGSTGSENRDGVPGRSGSAREDRYRESGTQFQVR